MAKQVAQTILNEENRDSDMYYIDKDSSTKNTIKNHPLWPDLVDMLDELEKRRIIPASELFETYGDLARNALKHGYLWEGADGLGKTEKGELLYILSRN